MKGQVLFNPKNPHKDTETLRWDFSEFAYFMNQILIGYQEHVVGALKALDVNEGEVFKAGDFGLNEEEKAYKKDWWERYRKQTIGVPEQRDNPGVDDKGQIR
jgi:hypothetical protein